jgi:4-amino-4-deoxychorismate lyase
MSHVEATWVNGRPADGVSVRDRGLQYGDGVFETIAVCGGAPLLWDRHLTRMRRGAERLGIALPPEAVWRDEAERACHGAGRAVLKLLLTRGESGRGYSPAGAGPPTRVLRLLPWPDYPAAHARDGVRARFCETRLAANPRLAGIKHLNRLEQVLARAEWNGAWAEGLMQDEAGHVIAGTMSNVFAVEEGRLLTPDLARCGVEGVMRAVVLERAPALGIPLRIGVLTRDNVLSATEIFLTNSLIGLWPIVGLEDRTYGIGPVIRQIQESLHDAQCLDERC